MAITLVIMSSALFLQGDEWSFNIRVLFFANLNGIFGGIVIFGVLPYLMHKHTGYPKLIADYDFLKQ